MQTSTQPTMPSPLPCHSDPDTFFVVGAKQHEVKHLCRPCPLRVRCLAEALDARIDFGVWGGMTQRERRSLRHRHPEVTSWARLLEQAEHGPQQYRRSGPPPRAWGSDRTRAGSTQ